MRYQQITIKDNLWGDMKGNTNIGAYDGKQDQGKVQTEQRRVGYGSDGCNPLGAQL